MTNSKKALLVVGPPRSGTSVVANIISKLDVHFGDPARFIDPEQQKHNPIFFELSSLNHINDAIFKYFSKNWSDFDWVPDRTDFTEAVYLKFEKRISDFIELEFGKSEKIGLKDPRFCYTLPLWETVLTRLGFDLTYILVRRSSTSVFKSNKAVNNHSTFTNFRLVAQSNILASHFVHGRPYVQVFYEDLLRDPRMSIREICKTAGLPFDQIEDACSILNKDLQHHEGNNEKPLFKYFSDVIDLREIAQDEYDKYREIFLAATHEKNKLIENLNLELAEKKQGGQDFPYWREALRMLAYLWQALRTLIPRYSRRERLVKFFVQNLIKFYKRVTERKYQAWINRFDVFSEREKAIASRQIESLGRRPLLSVLMPVYDPPLQHLDEAIKSIKAQVYPHWELCIADDASANPLVRSLIEKYAKDDSRIRYVFRPTNGHISASSNTALEIATGEFTVLLDHDDTLHPLALYYVAQEINKHPDVEVIYSDEDKLNESGKRVTPYFKSDFDYDLLLRHNMVSHLGGYRTAILREVGGFRVGFEGSQDYDLLLRIIEKIEAHQIRHIPRVLYHWRISNLSAASGAKAKPYAYDAGLRALRDHLTRQHVDSLVEPAPGYYAYRIKHLVHQPQPAVDIIICVTGFKEQLEQCVKSILSNTRYSNYRIMICSNSDIDGFHKINITDWGQDDRVSFVQEVMDVNQPKTINRAAAYSKADYICLLDESVYNFSSDWLDQLVGQASQPGVGVVGPLLLQPNGKIFSSGLILRPGDITVKLFAGLQKEPSYFGWATIPKGFSALSERCQLIKKSHFLGIGGYNTFISNLYYANIDFCLRLRENRLRNILVPIVEVYIHQDATYNQNTPKKQNLTYPSFNKDQKYIKDHWQSWLEHDPAFNPNLDLKKGRVFLTTSRRFTRD